LNDVLFAQYCLFLTIRIHDDFIDEDKKANAWLVAVGDDLLIEAEMLFARHVDDRAFWMRFRGAVRSTLDGMAEVERRQTRRAGMAATDRGLYAQVASVLSLAVCALLSRVGRSAEYPAFQRYAADVAIASQLLDDLQDLEADAARGRRNVAASLLIGPRKLAQLRHGTLPWRRAVAKSILVGDGAAAVFSLARRHAERAAASAKKMALVPAIDYAHHLSDHYGALEEAARATQRRALLRELSSA
jgi:geranylgeranyl pyrophosphate synthase